MVALPKGITLKKIEKPESKLVVVTKKRKVIVLDSKTLNKESTISLRRPIPSSVCKDIKTKYFCSKCMQTFESYLELTLHDASCERPRNHYTCKYCAKDFTTGYTYKAHVAKHEAVPEFVCKKCGKSFSNQESKEIHEYQLHTQYYDACADGDVQCKICDIKKKNRSMIVKHINSAHLVITPNLCEICGKCFSSTKQLLVHKVVHETEKTFQCGECFKSFKSKIALRAHLVTHEDRSYMCSICGKCFKKKYNLNCHVREHEGDYSIECTICGKKFVTKSAADAHAKTHQVLK